MRNIRLKRAAFLCAISLTCGCEHLYPPPTVIEKANDGLYVATRTLGEYSSQIGFVRIWEFESTKIVFEAKSETGSSMHGFPLKSGLNEFPGTVWSGFLMVVPGPEHGVQESGRIQIVKTEGFALTPGVRYEIKVCSPLGLKFCSYRSFTL